MTREVVLSPIRQPAAGSRLSRSCNDSYDSGDVGRSQGISRAGRGQVRGTMIQAAWLWLKHQPKSAITRWFVQRTAGQSGRIRRIMLIAVARKLAIALWRFLEQGLVPQGATLPTGNDTGGRSSTVPTLLRVRRAGRRCGCYGDLQIWPSQSAVSKMSPVLPARSSMMSRVESRNGAAGYKLMRSSHATWTLTLNPQTTSIP